MGYYSEVYIAVPKKDEVEGMINKTLKVYSNE